MTIHPLYILVLLSLLLTACAEESGSGKSQGRRAPPPPMVELLKVKAATQAVPMMRIATVEAAEAVAIRTQEAGRLFDLKLRPGDSVKTGEVLFRIDDRLLQAQLQKVLAERRLAEQELSRMQSLQSQQLVTDDALNQAEAEVNKNRADEALLRERLSYTVVRAPFDGIVSERLAEEGDIAQSYEHVFSLVSSGRYRLLADIPEQGFARIRPGMPVTVFLGNQTIEAEVSRLHPVLDSATRMGQIEVVLQMEGEHRLSSGQSLRIELALPPAPYPQVPLAAIQSDTRGSFVWQLDEEGKLMRTTIELAGQHEQQMAVRSGLQAGEYILAYSLPSLRTGMAVTVRQEQP